MRSVYEALACESESHAVRRLLVFLLSLVGIVGCVVAVWLWLLFREGARHRPSAMEALAARQLRRLAIPQSTRDMKNPVTATAEVLAEGRDHFADHCAVCHANDGSGEIELGRSLFPPAPDMRQEATQSLTDGELWFMIHNGIPLSGMPAWGGDDPNAVESWELVHFIRHLPMLTDREIAEMERRNPKGAHAREEEEEARRFLEGAHQ